PPPPTPTLSPYTTLFRSPAPPERPQPQCEPRHLDREAVLGPRVRNGCRTDVVPVRISAHEPPARGAGGVRGQPTRTQGLREGGIPVGGNDTPCPVRPGPVRGRSPHGPTGGRVRRRVAPDPNARR